MAPNLVVANNGEDSLANAVTGFNAHPNGVQLFATQRVDQSMKREPNHVQKL